MAQQAHSGDIVLEDAPANIGESSIPAQEGYSKNKRQGPRKRVSQACDKCRSRKDKCDGKKPVRIIQSRKICKLFPVFKPYSKISVLSDAAIFVS